MSNDYSLINSDKTEDAIALALDRVLEQRGETRANYPGMSDAEICNAIAGKMRSRSPVASVALRTGASALRQVRNRHGF